MIARRHGEALDGMIDAVVKSTLALRAMAQSEVLQKLSRLPPVFLRNHPVLFMNDGLHFSVPRREKRTFAGMAGLLRTGGGGRVRIVSPLF